MTKERVRSLFSAPDLAQSAFQSNDKYRDSANILAEQQVHFTNVTAAIYLLSPECPRLARFISLIILAMFCKFMCPNISCRGSQMPQRTDSAAMRHSQKQNPLHSKFRNEKQLSSLGQNATEQFRSQTNLFLTQNASIYKDTCQPIHIHAPHYKTFI